MSTRVCTFNVRGIDESEGAWVFDIHYDLHDGDRLDVFATTDAVRGAAEFSLNVPQARALHKALSEWLATDPETGKARNP